MKRSVKLLGLGLVAALGLGVDGCPPAAGPFKCADGSAATGFIEAPKGAEKTGKYIVGLKASAASRSAASLGMTGASRVGARMAVGTMTLAAAKAAAADPGVQFVQEETVKRIQGFEVEGPSSIESSETLWGRDRVDQHALPLDGADFAPNGTGAGIDVCIVDTGVDPLHPAVKGRLVAAHASLGSDTGDAHGHGTHVAGTAVSVRRGVAHVSAVLSCRCLNADGSGTDSSVAACIDWCAEQQKARGNPMALNMSLGGPVSPALDLSVCRAAQQGIAVVVAAGNSAHNACDGSPSRVDLAWTIGATDKPIKSQSGIWWETRSDFSNYGPCVDLFAPGRDILSARRGDHDDNDPVSYSGTSMASPHVCGAAALCLERGADLGACLIEASTKDSLAPDRVGDGSPNRLLYLGR